jgi:hypothetical protein
MNVYERMIVDGEENVSFTRRYFITGIYIQFGLIFIMFWMMVTMTSYISITLKDSKKLLTDGTDTLIDFGELIPQVNESLYILETLCHSKSSPIHEWCKP